MAKIQDMTREQLAKAVQALGPDVKNLRPGQLDDLQQQKPTWDPKAKLKPPA